MGLPLLVYNGRTIAFSQQCYRLQMDVQVPILNNVSLSGVRESLRRRTDISVDVGFRYFDHTRSVDLELKRKLKQWAIWALERKPWNFAISSDDLVYTVLDAAAAAGDTTLTLENMLGVVVGGLYIVRNTLDVDVVKVTAIAGSVVTLAEPLNAPYFVGDRFRSERVWTGRLGDDNYPLIERPPKWYDLEFRFVEDVQYWAPDIC